MQARACYELFELDKLEVWSEKHIKRDVSDEEWSNSSAPELLKLAQAIAGQNQQVLNQTWSQLLERLPAA